MMHQVAQKHGGLYNRAAMASYHYERYRQSLKGNGQFFFGPLALLLYGAASFLYKVFPNETDMLPTETVISSFFDAQPTDNGEWTSIPERIPPNWTKRKIPYTLIDVALEILELYLAPPVLFGGNIGRPSSFVPGTLHLRLDQQTVNGILCFLYQAILSVDNVPRLILT